MCAYDAVEPKYYIYLKKFCNKYFQYFFEFARINIYVIVNCSSILNDLAKALALLIGLQLKKSIGTANQDKLVKDGVLKVYALEIDPEKFKSFLTRDILKFTEPKFNLTDARKKKAILAAFSVKDGSWQMDLKSIRARRFKLEVESIYMGAKYKVEIQIERK